MTVHHQVIRRVIPVLALLVSGPVAAAGFTCAGPAETDKERSPQEPEEADLKASETTLSGKDMQSWLRRLVGQYTYGGYVDLCGNGNANDQRRVTGKADCIASGSAPNIHCAVNVRWPTATRENGAPVLGGVSNLAPAEFLFSMEIPRPPMFKGKAANGWGLVFLQLDSSGNAEWASGVLNGDTFHSREPCFDIPGDCHRIKRITVAPDDDEISMRVDIVINRERVLRQVFLLHRKPGTRQGERSTGASP
jgi:hypothetical protein